MKRTRKSLLFSAMSLLLCITMLLGTTYAWFTDSVTSGHNKIQAGNLDVELWHQNANTTLTEIEDNSEDQLFTDVPLWEPGAYAYETFTVKNAGSLALKFKMALNVLQYTSYNGHNLTEVIKAAVADTAPATRDAAAALTYTALDTWTLADYAVDNKLAAGADKTFTVVLYWEPTDHDNDYNMNNDRPSPLTIDFGVTLVATQKDSESDSFDTDYDKVASTELPAATKYESKLAEATSAPVTVPDRAAAVLTANATPTTNPAAEKQTTTVSFEAGALTAGEEAKLNVKTNNSLFEVKSSGQATVASIDLSLTVGGSTVTNFNSGKKATVSTYISAGLSDVTVVYNGTDDQPTDITYNAETGLLQFKTTHFSEYDVKGNAVAYILGNHDTGFAPQYAENATPEQVAAAIEKAYDDAAKAAASDVTAKVELTVDADMNKAAQAAENNETAFEIPTQYVQTIEKQASTADEKVQNNFVARIDSKYYGTLSAAAKAALATDTVILLQDTTITSSVLVNNKVFKLNGDGKTITFDAANKTSGFVAVFDGYNGTQEGIMNDLTVVNTKLVMKGAEPQGYGVVFQKAAEKYDIKFTDCSFDNMYCGLCGGGSLDGYTTAADITLDNCRFSKTEYVVSATPDYVGAMSFTDVSGYTKGLSEFHKVRVGNNYYTDLAAALNAAESGATVTLLNDYTPISNMTFNKSIILDLNGFGFVRTAEASGGYGIKLQPGCNLTVKNGSWDVAGAFGDISAEGSNGTCNVTYDKVVFTNLDIPANPKDQPGTSSHLEKNVFKANMQGGFIINASFIDCVFNNARVEFSGFNSDNVFTGVFTRCTFNNTTNTSAIEGDNYGCAEGCSLTITDCTFNMNVTSNVEVVETRYNGNKVALNLSGNTINGTVADSSIYNLFSTTSLKFYNASQKFTVTESGTTLQGIAKLN